MGADKSTNTPIDPQSNSVDELDVILSLKGGSDCTLPQVVASGRLFVLNGKGEYEPVLFASYWRNDAIVTVWDDGEEIDEDGNVVRVFGNAG